VLLQVVTDSGDVRGHLDAVGQTNARDFPQRRVRFLRRLGVNAGTNSTLLRRTLQRGARRLVLDLLAAFANKLINRRHLLFLVNVRVTRAKRPLAYLFPEPVRQSAQATGLKKN
jgi:hypothetical protein